jgi:hypothetical protein
VFNCVLDWLQRAIIAVVLVLFFQGKGAHGVFIAILGAIPVLRFTLSLSYRKNCTDKYRRFFGELNSQNIPVRALFAWIVLPFLILVLANGISMSSYDNYGAQLTASSLVTDGNLELSEFHPETSNNPYFFTLTTTGYRSSYPLGMVAPLLPVSIVARMLGANFHDGLVQWRLAKWTAAWLSAIALVLFFLIARSYVSRSAALFTTAFLAFGSVFTTTLSQGVWSHDGVVLGMLGVIFIGMKSQLTSQILGRDDLICAFLIAWMFACRLSSAVFIVPLLIWLYQRRNFPSLFRIATGAVLFHVPLNIYYWKHYGNVLGPQMQMAQGLWKLEQPFLALAGLLFSPARGLFVYQPWLLLLSLYLLPPVRSKIRSLGASRTLLLFACLTSALHLALISTWPVWNGGYCWGSRLLSEIVAPLAFLVLFPVEYLLENYSSAAKPLLTGLAIFSFLLHLPQLFLFAGFWDGDPRAGNTEWERVWNWSRPPFLYPFQRK